MSEIIKQGIFKRTFQEVEDAFGDIYKAEANFEYLALDLCKLYNAGKGSAQQRKLALPYLEKADLWIEPRYRKP